MSIQLLVSVRSGQEALTACDNGADIIDVKEPDSGSLGFAGAAMIRDVVNAVADRVPVSAALGECRDWSEGNLALDELQSDGMKYALSFVKLGLAGLLDTAAQNAWVVPWLESRRRFDRSPLSATVATAGSGSRSEQRTTSTTDSHPARPRWVGVVYADHARAGAPQWQEVLYAARISGCEYLLIDTHGKDGSSTLDWLPESELVEIRKSCQESQLLFALAGQLNQSHLPCIKRIQPDVFAVRGAVCDGLDRRSTVSAQKVRILKQALQ